MLVSRPATMYDKRTHFKSYILNYKKKMCYVMICILLTINLFQLYELNCFPFIVKLLTACNYPNVIVVFIS